MKAGGFPTSQAAEEAFYEAFEKADVDAMMAVWADEDHILCVHPMGPRLQGRAAVAESWRRIFSNGAAMRLTITDARLTQSALLAVHVVHEHIATPERPEGHPPLVATNIYQLTDGGWRLILHHASPAPASQRQAQEPGPEGFLH